MLLMKKTPTTAEKRYIPEVDKSSLGWLTLYKSKDRIAGDVVLGHFGQLSCREGAEAVHDLDYNQPDREELLVVELVRHVGIDTSLGEEEIPQNA